MSLPSFLAYILPLVDQYKYILIVIGTVIEGPIIMVASGFLLHLEVVTLVPLFIALFIGDLIGDVFWYAVGRYFAEPMIQKHGHFFSISRERFEKAKALFSKYQVKILLVSKVTMGFGLALATLVAAGASRVPFRKYLALNMIGEVVFVSMLLVVGYFFGSLYTYIDKAFKGAFLLGALLIVLCGGYGLSQYLKKKVATL